MVNVDCVISGFRHRSKCLHVCPHLIFSVVVETNTITIVHFIGKETDTKRLRNVLSATKLASSLSNKSCPSGASNQHARWPACCRADTHTKPYDAETGPLPTVSA